MRKKCACVPPLGGALPVPLPAMYCLLVSILQDVADLVLVLCFFAIALCSSLGSVLARYVSAALTRGTDCPSSSSLSCSEGLAHPDANMFNLCCLRCFEYNRQSASSGKALLDHHQEGGCWKAYTYWDACARPTICACFFVARLCKCCSCKLVRWWICGTIAKTYGTGSRRWLHESSSMELAPYHIMLQ